MTIRRHPQRKQPDTGFLLATPSISTTVEQTLTPILTRSPHNTIPNGVYSRTSTSHAM